MAKFNHSIKLEAAFRSQYALSNDQLWGTRVSRLLENTSLASVRAIAIGSAKPVTEWVGNRESTPLKDFKLDYENKNYETNFVIDRDSWERDEVGLYQAEAQALGLYMADKWSKMVAATLLANPTWYDGSSMIGAHNITGGTQTNALTSTQIGDLDVSTVDTNATAANPGALAAGQILNKATMYAQSVVNEANFAVNSTARHFLIVAGTATLAGSYRSAINRENLAGGVTSDIDALKKQGYTYEVVQDNALASVTDAVYMFVVDTPNKAFILHSEQSPRFEIDYSMAGHTNDILVGTSQRRSIIPGRYTSVFKLTHV